MKILLGMIVLVWLMKADSLPPSLIWIQTGDAWDSANGISEGVGCGSNGSCMLTQTFDRNFTVTSPGLFDLSTLDVLAITVFNCYPTGCSSSANAYGNVMNVNSIAGPVSFDQSASNSGQSTQPCGGTNCSTYLTFNVTADSTVFLPLGDYTLQDEVTYTITGEEVFGGVTLNATLVPALVLTPEPRSTALVLVSGLLTLVGLRRRFASL
jgi:hypothetical protein